MGEVDPPSSKLFQLPSAHHVAVRRDDLVTHSNPRLSCMDGKHYHTDCPLTWETWFGYQPLSVQSKAIHFPHDEVRKFYQYHHMPIKIIITCQTYSSDIKN